ncbi:MAG: hypothetical protein N2594_03640 [Clostridiales bacterium]|nr:hypothetical protein [Clostridiales bacterium]
MKKIFLGTFISLLGFVGILTFIILSVIKPWDYNGITGLYGFLLGTKNIFNFFLFLIMFIVGIGICFYEAYIKK